MSDGGRGSGGLSRRERTFQGRNGAAPRHCCAGSSACRSASTAHASVGSSVAGCSGSPIADGSADWCAASSWKWSRDEARRTSCFPDIARLPTGTATRSHRRRWAPMSGSNTSNRRCGRSRIRNGGSSSPTMRRSIRPLRRPSETGCSAWLSRVILQASANSPVGYRHSSSRPGIRDPKRWVVRRTSMIPALSQHWLPGSATVRLSGLQCLRLGRMW